MSLRTRSSIRTFCSQELFTIVSVLGAMVCTPILLHWLGDDRYGAFETVTGWAGYIALLEGGIGEAIQALLARAFGNRSRDSTRKILVASFRLYSRVAALMVVVGVALLPIISWLIPVSAGQVHDLRIAWLVGLGTAPLLPLNAFKVLAQVEQRGYRVNTLLVGHWLIVTIASLLLAWAGWGITGQAAAVLLGGILFSFALAFLEQRGFQALFTAALFEPVDKEIWHDISQLRWPGLIFNLCGTFSYLTDNMIVAFMLSPATVVPFYITQRLPTLAMRELQGIGGSSWAALTELHTQAKYDIFNERLIELTQLIAILAVAGLLPIIAYNHYFVERWVGISRYGGNALTVITAFDGLLLAVFSLWVWVMNSTGNVRYILPAMTAQTIMNLGGSILFTHAFGLIGPALGTLVAFVTVSAWYFPFLMKRIFQTKPSALVWALVQPIALGMPYALLVFLFSATRGAADWFTIGWQMGVAALGYLGIASLILLTKAERNQWIQRLRVAL